MGCDIHAYSEIKKYGWEFKGAVSSNRDYVFFGLIAGVRKPEIKIYDAKGFPENASIKSKAIYDLWSGDAHSASFLTLAELKAIDKSKMIKISGMMDREQLKKCKADFAAGNYDSEHLYPYCQGTNITTHEHFELEMPVISKTNSVQNWIEELEKIKPADATDEQVRVVFFFDN